MRPTPRRAQWRSDWSPPVGRNPAGSVATILLVDDDAVLNEALGGALASEGHAVQVACTAAEALVAMESMQPDLILLDLTLPDTDGLTLLQKRREADAGWSTPL